MPLMMPLDHPLGKGSSYPSSTKGEKAHFPCRLKCGSPRAPISVEGSGNTPTQRQKTGSTMHTHFPFPSLMVHKRPSAPISHRLFHRRSTLKAIPPKSLVNPNSPASICVCGTGRQHIPTFTRFVSYSTIARRSCRTRQSTPPNPPTKLCCFGKTPFGSTAPPFAARPAPEAPADMKMYRTFPHPHRLCPHQIRCRKEAKPIEIPQPCCHGRQEPPLRYQPHVDGPLSHRPTGPIHYPIPSL